MKVKNEINRLIQEIKYWEDAANNSIGMFRFNECMEEANKRRNQIKKLERR